MRQILIRSIFSETIKNKIIKYVFIRYMNIIYRDSMKSFENIKSPGRPSSFMEQGEVDFKARACLKDEQVRSAPSRTRRDRTTRRTRMCVGSHHDRA